jgi:hypothetical protein
MAALLAPFQLRSASSPKIAAALLKRHADEKIKSVADIA